MSEKSTDEVVLATVDIRSHTFESTPDADGWVVSGSWIESTSTIRFTSFTVRNVEPQNKDEVTWDVLRANIQMRAIRNGIYAYMLDYFEEALVQGTAVVEFLRERGESVQLEIAERKASEYEEIHAHIQTVKPSLGGRPRTTADDLAGWALDLLAAVDENESTFTETLRYVWRKRDGTKLSSRTVRHRIAQIKRNGLIKGIAPNYQPTGKLTGWQKGN